MFPNEVLSRKITELEDLIIQWKKFSDKVPRGVRWAAQHLLEEYDSRELPVWVKVICQTSDSDWDDTLQQIYYEIQSDRSYRESLRDL
jgi:hypothetical protein